MIRHTLLNRVRRALVAFGYTSGVSVEAISWFAYEHGYKLNRAEVVYLSQTF